MKKRILSVFLCAAMLCGLLGALLPTLAASGLTVSGSGCTGLTLTAAQLGELPTVRYTYSVINNYPTPKIVYAEGVLLSTILNKAGLKSSCTQLTFTASDGYQRTFTKEELLNDTRYYYPSVVSGSSSGGQQVSTIIALRYSEDGFSSLQATTPRLIMGQRRVNEQNNPWIVRDLYKIEASTASVAQWSAPGASPSPGTVPAGSDVTLSHPQIDNIKIYYTTDGSTPTLSSKMYNVSGTSFQPKLNVPITINQSCTVKAIAIGPGKQNSAVSTFTYTVSSSGGTFSDLSGYEWAAPAINGLAKAGVVSGVGGGKFNPGGYLQRSEGTKMIVLALGQQPTTYKGIFSDVAASAWYADYVQKAYNLNLIEGVGGGKFNPTGTLTREQLLAIIIRALGKDSQARAMNSASYLSQFASLSRISTWAYGYVALAEQLGLIEHGHIITTSGGKLSFDGMRSVTRAEAADMIWRMMGNR